MPAEKSRPDSTFLQWTYQRSDLTNKRQAPGQQPPATTSKSGSGTQLKQSPLHIVHYLSEVSLYQYDIRVPESRPEPELVHNDEVSTCNTFVRQQHSCWGCDSSSRDLRIHTKPEEASLSRFHAVSFCWVAWVCVCLFFFLWPYSVKVGVRRKRHGPFKFALPCSTCRFALKRLETHAQCTSLINVSVNNTTNAVTRGSPSH